MKSYFLPSLRIAALVLLSFTANCQYMEKVSFDAGDSTNGYYLAIPPASNNIKGVLVFLCGFRSPESLLPETKLHNVAAGSDLLTIYASLGRKIMADPATISRIDAILQHVVTKYKADTAAFALGGFDMAGTAALRYTELAYEHPAEFPLLPKAVFAVSSYVDLSGLYRVSERQIKKNYFPPAMGDARIFLDSLTKELGTLADHPEHYKQASPFYRDDEAAGNERFLQQAAVRLYYDTDIAWQLANRRNSLYDTNIPDGTELINRLLLAGSKNAEFISSRLPGLRSNGMRSPVALSIVDEVDCIQWIKKKLHVFDPNNPISWEAPYKFIVPDGWRMERATLPGPFAAHVTIRGIEDIRFPPGWGDAKSDEYWSVAYLLWLEGGQKIDAAVLQNNVRIYYDDLIAGALIRRNLTIPAGTIAPTRVTIKQTKTDPDDVETYAGTIGMFDYLGQKPMILNYRVHVKDCSAQNHIPVFLEISPQPFDHPLWQELEMIKRKFVCVE